MNALKKTAAAVGSFALAVPAFAVGPSAGDLTSMVPDNATILTAVGSVAVVLLSIVLAIKGFKIVRGLVNRG